MYKLLVVISRYDKGANNMKLRTEVLEFERIVHAQAAERKLNDNNDPRRLDASKYEVTRLW